MARRTDRQEHHTGRAARRTHTRSRRPLLRQLETLAALAGVALLVTGMALAYSPHDSKQPELVSIKVHSGDTLWSVAEEHPVDGLSTAETAQLIAKTNSLEGSLVRADTTLRVPATASSTNLADNRGTTSSRQ